ncbi:hypothetical protein CR513_13260, partial [Mucuna pruriens]
MEGVKLRRAVKIEKIESLYASKYGNNKLFLLNSTVSLKFKEGTSVLDHLNEFQGILDQMLEMSIKFEDKILELLLLNSLPESWETFKVSLTNSTPNGIVLLQMVNGSVLNEKMRRKAQVKIGREVRKRNKKEEEKIAEKKEKKGKKGKSKEKDHDDNNDRVTTVTGNDLVILRDFESFNLVSDESMWIIDSGATLHVTPKKEFFTSYTIGDFGVLKMGNDGVTKEALGLYFEVKEPSVGELPKHLWGEALYTVVHVININPTIALNTEVPDKIWFYKDVKYDHLRIFYCNAFVHIPKDKRSKLDMKTRQCIFIGYVHDEYGYRLYDPVKKKLVRSRDVQFMEDQTIENIDKNGKQHNYVGDQQLGDGFDIPLDDDAEEEQ